MPGHFERTANGFVYIRHFVSNPEKYMEVSTENITENVTEKQKEEIKEKPREDVIEI